MVLDGTTIVVAVIGGICSSSVMSFFQFLINRREKKSTQIFMNTFMFLITKTVAMEQEQD